MTELTRIVHISTSSFSNKTDFSFSLLEPIYSDAVRMVSMQWGIIPSLPPVFLYLSVNGWKLVDTVNKSDTVSFVMPLARTTTNDEMIYYQNPSKSFQSLGGLRKIQNFHLKLFMENQTPITSWTFGTWTITLEFLDKRNEFYCTTK